MSRWRISSRGPLEPTLIIRMLAAHGIPGVERTEVADHRHTRLLPTPTGLQPVTVTVEPTGVVVDGPDDEAEREPVDRLVRRWFDLDADLEPVRAALGRDPLLAPLVAARPGLRVVEYPLPFEAAMATVLGQQVSVAAARTFGGRLAAAYGTPGPDGLLVFPSPDAVADADPVALQAAVGVTRFRTATLQAVASAYRDRPPDQTPSRAELLALPGIGPWSADYLAVRSVGDRDAFTAGDLVLRRAIGGLDTKAAYARAEAWRPYRAYALFHLWISAAYLP